MKVPEMQVLFLWIPGERKVFDKAVKIFMTVI